jgi:hypothetical protein
MGFAGSVTIGFSMVDRMRELLACPPNSAWMPEVVAEWWPDDARKVYLSFDEATRRLGCHLMMFSVHPNDDNGLWPRAFVYIFKSPHFEPIPVRPSDAMAIGSGAASEPCRTELERLCSDDEHKFDLMQAEVGTPGGIATVLSFDLAMLIRKHEPTGVSPHLHICAARRGNITVFPNNFITHTEKGPVEFTMPIVANNLAGLQSLLSEGGDEAVGCTC